MTVQTQIESLIGGKLAGNEINPAGVIDELLALAGREGEIHCTCVNNQALRFTVLNPPVVFEVPLARAQGILRMMCARLGVLCEERGSLEGTLYGGEGAIPIPLDAVANRAAKYWRVRFMNTPGEHFFMITPVESLDSARQVRQGALTVRTRIEQLVADKWLGREIDPAGFVDELLAIVSREAEMHCTIANAQVLRFAISDPRGFEVFVKNARPVLRTICARLGALCTAYGHWEGNPSGGEGSFPFPPGMATHGTAKLWKVRFMNTPGEDYFTITPVATRQEAPPTRSLQQTGP